MFKNFKTFGFKNILLYNIICENPRNCKLYCKTLFCSTISIVRVRVRVRVKDTIRTHLALFTMIYYLIYLF